MELKRLRNGIGYGTKWCICAIVFAAPFSKSISEIAVALAIALWVVGKIIDGDCGIKPTPLGVPLLLFVVAAFLSLFNSHLPALSVKAFFTKIVKFVALFFVIAESIDTKEKLRDIFTVLCLSMCVIVLDGFVQYYYTGVDFLHHYPSFKARNLWDGAGLFLGFPTASFPYPNDLAAWILLTFFPLLSVALFNFRTARSVLATTVLLAGAFYLFFLTKTRGAWVGFASSILYLIIVQKKIWLVVLIIFVLLAPYLLKMEMAEYLFSTGSFTDRMSMIGTSVEIFKKHPVFGNGVNTYFENFKQHRADEWRGKKGSYAHNCYLQMACDLGIFGLAMFLWAMIAFFGTVLRRLDDIKDRFLNAALLGIALGLCAFLVHSFFDTNLYSLNLATLFWVALGIGQSVLTVGLKERSGGN